MELSLVLGGFGILVSIAVGFGTYYLAERRGRRNRWQASKDTVLRDLSKSLGEGSVPQPAVILATIRSVLRSQNAPDLAVVTLEEVKDDLLRQITADPFLEAERRTQLQTQVLELKAPETPSGPPGPRAAAEAWLERETLWTQFSFAALLAGVLASLVAGVAFTGVPEIIKAIERLRTAASQTTRDPFLILVPIIAAFLTVVASLVPTLARAIRDRQKHDR